MFVDGDVPRTLPDGRPDWRFAVFPRRDAEIIDSWDALGLRGTGSHDVRTTDTHVPEELTFMGFDSVARHDGPLWRLSYWGLLGVLIVGFPHGVARRALVELAELAPNRRLPGVGEPIAADAVLQVAVARAEARLASSRAFVDDAVADAWDTACDGDPVSAAQLSRFQLAALESMEAAIGAVDCAFRAGGGSVVYTNSPLARCFRDIHTAAQHTAFYDTPYRSAGRARLHAAGV
jgi:indole-3-acetate monooxygenase